ncbi:MAG: NYN domain-containing protein, partial [Candidatus Omnitrophica bacterium]|nr:NYN domain-containing protein [Candidatus Omnitrophota bacterium]
RPSRVLDRQRSTTPAEKIISLIKKNKLTGSSKNKVTVVFDGYPPSGQPPVVERGMDIIFARGVSADEKIKSMVETSANPKNIFVVSDDKEIRFMIKALGARSLTIDDFINQGKDVKSAARRDDSSELKLRISEMEQVNKELRRLWLE